MSGILIVGALLQGSAPFTAVVEAGRLKAWALPEGTLLPSGVLTRISRTEQQFLSRQPYRQVTERVQLTVRAANGDQRVQILKLARQACGDQIGTIAGFANAAVLLAGEGPDFMDDAASIFMGSTDFRVSFTEPA